MASKEIACLPEDCFQQDWKSSRPIGNDEFILTKVFGLTNISKNALDCNQVTGYVGFPASSMLVLLDPKTNNQKFLKCPSAKSISCCSFSDDGKIVTIGECGVKPHVYVWTLKDYKESGRFRVDHSVGIKALAIHPKFTYVVVIGMHDLNIGVWDYVRCQRLALTKWQTIPMSLTIPKTGASVILCGHRKITLFNLDKINSNCYETNVFEDKKAVLLGRQSEYTFVDISSGKGKYDKSVFTVTNCGYVCEVRLGDILIDKACKVDNHAYCIRFALNNIFIGCCEGVVKICNPDTLNVSVAVSLSQLLGSDAFPQSSGKLFLETTALSVNEKDSIVTCIYSNCSIYSWQINNLSDRVECSILLPSENNKQCSSEINTCFTENMYRESMFRSLMGCFEFDKNCRLFDSVTMAARNGMRCHHDLIHFLKGNISKNQHVTTIRFTPDGRDVICGNEAGEIKVYDAVSGILRRVIEAHSAQVMCIELLYDSDYQLVCTGGRDRIIFILNAKEDFSLVQVLCDHSAAITAVSLVCHNGLLTLVSAAADNLILVRRSTPGSTLKFTVTGQIVESRCNKALNVIGDYIITGDKSGNIKLFKADPIFNPKLSKTLKGLPKSNNITSMLRPMCIDSTGSFIATAHSSGLIVIYHLSTGQHVASLSAQTDVSAISFTSCFKYIITSTLNGCAMIWKIPDRMTDFLVTKHNKSCEVAKEVSYETTIVSCVKICKELTVRESNIDSHCAVCTGPNSNHNYDTDATPGIESLSFPLGARCSEAESERSSICSTDSYLSCSTCRDSCSDTVHWCPSSDSSAMTNSGLDRFCFANGDNMCGKIIETSECRKLGPFRNCSDEAIEKSIAKENVPCLSFNSNSKMYKAKIGESCAIGDCKEAIDYVSVDTECVNVSEGLKKRELRDFHTKIENITNSDLVCRIVTRDSIDHGNLPAVTETHTSTITNEINTINIQKVEATTRFADTSANSDQQNKFTSLKTSFNASNLSTHTHNQKSKHPNVNFLDSVLVKDYKNYVSSFHTERTGFSSNCTQLGLLSSSPINEKELYAGSSPISYCSFRTACSPKQVTSIDTSCSPGNSIFYSPSPCFSTDSDEHATRTRSPFLQAGMECKDLDNGCEGVRIKQQCDKMSSTLTFVGNLSTIKSSRSNEPSDVIDSLSHSETFSVLSTNEKRVDNIILREINQTFLSDQTLQQQAHSVENNEGPRKITIQAETSPQKLTSTMMQNTMCSNLETRVSDVGKEICETNFEQMSAIKLSFTNVSNDDIQNCQAGFVTGGDTVEKCQLSASELIEEEMAYNYHSITRDESGKLRLVVNIKNNEHVHPFFENKEIKSPKEIAEYDSPSRFSEIQQAYNESTLRNIQCSRCSHREDVNHDVLISPTAMRCHKNSQQIFHLSQESHNSQTKKPQELCETASSLIILKHHCEEEDADEEYMNDMNDDKLEEYFSEVRQCLQLTNSQETVYKLACDAQDRELMELLELVLKKNSSPSTETANSPCNEAKLSDASSSRSASLEHTDLQEMARDFANYKFKSTGNTFECAHNKVIPILLNADISEDKCCRFEHDPSSDSTISQTSEVEGLTQDAAKALITLVGRILKKRKECQIINQNGAVMVEQATTAETQISAENNSTKPKLTEEDNFVKKEIFKKYISSNYQFAGKESFFKTQPNSEITRNYRNQVPREISAQLNQKTEKSRDTTTIFNVESKDTTNQLSGEQTIFRSQHPSVNNSGQTGQASSTSQTKLDKETHLFTPRPLNKSHTQQEATSGNAHNNNRQIFNAQGYVAPRESQSEKIDCSDSLSEASLLKTLLSYSGNRYGNLCSNLTFDSGTDSSMTEKLSPTTTFNHGDRIEDKQGDSIQSDATFAESTPKGIMRSPVTGDKLAQLRSEESSQQHNSCKGTNSQVQTKVQSLTEEVCPVQETLVAVETKQPQHITELFKDQDEYLRKLKEVRAKFEMSIQALSNERKCRLAEEDKQQNK